MSSVSMISMSCSGFDFARDVHDVVVHEAAHEMRDRMRLANVREELVAEPLALRRAFDEARDVDELDDGRHDLLGFHDLRQRVELWIGHGHDADVRIDRAERIVLGRNLRRRERVEQRRLADVRQPDDAALDAHGLVGLRFTSVQTILGALGAVLEQDGQKVGRFFAAFRAAPLPRRGRALQHVVDHFLRPPVVLLVARMADAEAQAPERGADVLDDAADAVVAGAAAVESELRAARTAGRARRRRRARARSGSCSS